MDGTTFTPVITLDEVIDMAMASRVPFSHLAQLVAVWVKERGGISIATDRLVTGSVAQIKVLYWDASGTRHDPDFDEWPSYTRAQSLSTW